MRLILASQSPARAKLLRDAHFNFSIVVSDAPEIADPAKTVAENCADFALKKAKKVASTAPDALVIGADTVCLSPIDGKMLGKPKNETEARAMLRSFSGHQVEVLTAVSVVFGNRELSELDRSFLYFSAFGEAEIDAFLTAEHKTLMRCAGALSIEHFGLRLIERIEGDPWAVIGLPICRIARMIREAKKGALPYALSEH